MPSIRIWTLESDNDARAVKCLAEKLTKHFHLDNLSIRWAGKKAFRAINKKNRSSTDGLKAAAINYLKEDDCVIFVIDNDGPMSREQRRLQPDSLLNQIQRVISDNSLKGKVSFAPAIQEIESWLLVDCLGISCFFASKKYGNKCRSRVSQNRALNRLVRSYQKGDTELIVEAEIGGRGPKEYLREFTMEILSELNPKMSNKDINRTRYRDEMSPGIAEFVEIDRDTLGRNKSLRRLGALLKRVS